MTFTVTYRGADGAPKAEAVEAASRAECLAQMKTRGIAPLSVKEGDSVSRRERRGRREGWGKNGRAAASAKAMAAEGRVSRAERVDGKVVACVLSVALVALIGGGVWWWLERSPKTVTLPEAPKSKALAKEVTPAAAPKPIPVQEAETPKENPNRALRQELAKMTKEERMDYAFKEMQSRKIPLAPKTNRIFRTGIEASMARIFMTQLGDPPPPPFTTAIPLRDEAHLAEILIAHNPVLETDTEAQKASKEMVALAKKEMMDYIRNGGNPEDFLKYYHGKLKEAFEFRRESMKSLIQVSRDDPSITAEYLDRLNKELADKGIKQIELNEKQRKRLGLE